MDFTEFSASVCSSDLESNFPISGYGLSQLKIFHLEAIKFYLVRVSCLWYNHRRSTKPRWTKRVTGNDDDNDDEDDSDDSDSDSGDDTDEGKDEPDNIEDFSLPHSDRTMIRCGWYKGSNLSKSDSMVIAVLAVAAATKIMTTRKSSSLFSLQLDQA